MGHLEPVRFSYEEKDLAVIDSMLRSAPHFSRYDERYGTYEFRRQSDGSDGDSTPDCAVTIETYGLLFNALGDYEVCNAVDAHLTKGIAERLGVIQLG